MQKGRKVPLPPDVRQAIIEGSSEDFETAIRDLLCRAALPATTIEYMSPMPDTSPYERGYLARYQDRRRKRYR